MYVCQTPHQLKKKRGLFAVKTRAFRGKNAVFSRFSCDLGDENGDENDEKFPHPINSMIQVAPIRHESRTNPSRRSHQIRHEGRTNPSQRSHQSVTKVAPVRHEGRIQRIFQT